MLYHTMELTPGCFSLRCTVQAVSPFLYALGKQFNKYLPTFMPYLRTGLTNYKEVQVGYW